MFLLPAQIEHPLGDRTRDHLPEYCSLDIALLLSCFAGWKAISKQFLEDSWPRCCCGASEIGCRNFRNWSNFDKFACTIVVNYSAHYSESEKKCALSLKRFRSPNFKKETMPSLLTEHTIFSVLYFVWIDNVNFFTRILCTKKYFVTAFFVIYELHLQISKRGCTFSFRSNDSVHGDVDNRGETCTSCWHFLRNVRDVRNIVRTR